MRTKYKTPVETVFDLLKDAKIDALAYLTDGKMGSIEVGEHVVMNDIIERDKVKVGWFQKGNWVTVRMKPEDFVLSLSNSE